MIQGFAHYNLRAPRPLLEELRKFYTEVVGLSVGDTTLGTLVANLGYDQLVMPSPVFIGDTMRATSEVVELTDSKSRPTAGIVTFRHELINQHDQVVCRCLRSALLKRKAA